MSVDPAISLKLVQKELEQCKKNAERFGWTITEINEIEQTFTIAMASPIDKEVYIMEVKFDNYKEWPPLIEFIHPITKERGTKNAYPMSSGIYGSFFHNRPCICHPCSRKAYGGYTGLHNDWGDPGSWLQNPKIGSLTNIYAILQTIYIRISNPEAYGGRMSG